MTPAKVDGEDMGVRKNRRLQNFTGVEPNGSGFKSLAQYLGKRYYFGTYRTPEEAFAARTAGLNRLAGRESEVLTAMVHAAGFKPCGKVAMRVRDTFALQRVTPDHRDIFDLAGNPAEQLPDNNLRCYGCGQLVGWCELEVDHGFV